MKRLLSFLSLVLLVTGIADAQRPALVNASLLNVSTRGTFFDNVPLRFGAGYWIKYNSVTGQFELCNASNTLFSHNGTSSGILGGATLNGSSDNFVKTQDQTSGTSKNLLIYTGSGSTGRGKIYLGASANTPTWVNEVWVPTPAQGDSTNKAANTGYVMRAIHGITGGGGTPAGETGHVQFNTGGAFDSDTSFYYDRTMKWLWVPTVVSTDLVATYLSASRIEGDSASLDRGIKLAYMASPMAATNTRGQIWASNADERPRYTDDGGYTFEMSLPGQTGNSGKFLTTNGTTASWATVSSGGGTPGGSSGQIQFNNSSAFGGIPNFTFDGTDLFVGPGTSLKFKNDYGVALYELQSGGTVTARLHCPSDNAFTIDGSVGNWAQFTDSYQKLYYSSAEKLSTTSTGIAVSGQATVTDEVYGAGWDASTSVPTKNAVYDKIESLSFSGTPGGSNTYLQFNDNGVFGGTSDLVYNGTDFSVDDDAKLRFLSSGGSVLFQLYGSSTSTARINSPNNIALSITGTSDANWAQFSSTYQRLYYSGSSKFETTTSGVAITGQATVTDDAYAASWDGSTEVPTKNALYDKIESLSAGGGAPTTARYLTATADATLTNEVNLGSLTSGFLYGTVSAGTSTLSSLSGISESYLSLSDVTTGNVSTTKHGFVPKGTNLGKFLRDDGTWQTVSASPGGSSLQVQYNNSGAFGGFANVTYSSGHLKLGNSTKLMLGNDSYLQQYGTGSDYVELTVNGASSTTNNFEIHDGVTTKMRLTHSSGTWDLFGSTTVTGALKATYFYDIPVVSEPASPSTGYVRLWFDSSSSALLFKNSTGGVSMIQTGLPMSPAPSPKPAPDDAKCISHNEQVLVKEYSPDMMQFRSALMIYENGTLVKIDRGPWQKEHKSILDLFRK